MSESLIKIGENILGANTGIAEQNRQIFKQKGILVVNLMSSPGSGKTTLLERTIKDLKYELRIAVIEGDQQTDRDSQRIEAAGAPVFQINTINACHLDANIVQDALRHFNMEDLDILFIENVGNLICPGAFDLGEDYRAIVISIAEGEDKPLKYPGIFSDSHIAVVNKIDVAEALEADPQRYVSFIKKVSPSIECMCVSAKTGYEMSQWYNWLRKKRNEKKII